MPQDEGRSLCTADCGLAGQPCCGNGTGCDNSICHDATNMCVSDYDPECNGSTLYYVPTRHIQTKCVDASFPTTADSAADATKCAQKLLAENGLTNVIELLPPQTTEPMTTTYPFCPTSGNPPYETITVESYSSSDALTCVESTCSNCGFTSGACSSS